MSSSKDDLPPLTTTDTRGSISAIPLHEVEPSPVEDDDDSYPWNEKSNDNNDGIDTPDYPTNPSDVAADVEKYQVSRRGVTSSASSTNFLGLTPARTAHILSSVQKYTTVPPTLFLAMHYTNTAVIPLILRDARAADTYLLLTRPYYQSFPLEPLMVFIPVALHVASGIALRIYRRRIVAKRHGAETHAQRKSIPWPKLSLTSALGYMMYPLLVGHMAVMRITPLKVEGSSAGVGLRYFAHGIAHNPWIGHLGYATFISIASFHFVTGTAKYLKLSREYITEGGLSGSQRRKWRGRIINAVAATVAAVWIAGGLGVVGRAGLGQGWEAKNWDRIYAAVPLLGSMFRS
ncbi:hypothetical protein HRR83_001546 [Exophiala dermatitidis]|uniref:Mitochondrial adapter protein MCP1 transmembrane domain-containing protein n=2 Tax=Exophiala dermatitidis TaxID=5970 RepID=H6C637_EXODN|nr:uncharacterized protein HMPREF1120_07180 [Exophiala dermatitidis NIH/UT8656]KAJ4516219.1 hypothetical protein HRR73_004680 [Exophiala dermatitidis]EHY59183.1 hypothetical protein HMPREF1120_07180 [Exophiala dermatitidis NIH/UT8656]KAJ4523030.1 hypothetical protein HRR75_001427 [Exophiala dermatitidis]KAJ4526354.1 hypothetical protein HRR74_001550 [Exophiala dermatitidis]KAJ4532405.1 hypothetical protein HRR76_007401 [Exophiala dermatitidis]